MGFSVVRALATRGVSVHFIGTNRDKGRDVERRLGGLDVRFVRLDLSDLGAVRSFAENFKTQQPRLDVLANIAGVMLPERVETADGIEKTFAIDHLAAFLLSRHLTPLLAAADNGRIVNVSGAPTQLLKPSLDFDDVQLRRNYSLMRAAINAVHAKTVMTELLSERLKSDGIDVNAFHPGAVKSELFRHMRFPMSALFRTARLFMSADSTAGIHVSTAESLNGVTGKFFVGRRPRPLAFERGYKERLWQATLDALPAGLA